MTCDRKLCRCRGAILVHFFLRVSIGHFKAFLKLRGKALLIEHAFNSKRESRERGNDEYNVIDVTKLSQLSPL